MNDKVKIAIVDNDIDKTVFPEIVFKDIMFGIVDNSQHHATFIAGILIDKLEKYKSKIDYTNSGAYIFDLLDDFDKQSLESVKYINDLSEKLLDHHFINCSFLMPTLQNKAESLNFSKWKEAYLKDDAKALMITGAGNNDTVIPGSTFLLQNIPYSLNIGGFYKNRHRFDKDTIIYSENSKTSKPSPSVMFVENGLQCSYNTKSNEDHVQAYYNSKKHGYDGFLYNDELSKFPQDYIENLMRVEKYAMGGSSFSAPTVLALLAEALLENSEKNLSKHDLIDIALHASDKPFVKRLTDSWSDKSFSEHVRTFQYNKSTEKNGEGYAHSLELGFGNIDHERFKNLAKSWIKTKNDMKEIDAKFVSESKNREGQFVYNFHIEDSFRVQQIQVNYKGIDTSSWGFWSTNKYKLSDLELLKVESPSGTISIIYDQNISPKTNKKIANTSIDFGDEIKIAHEIIFSEPLYGSNKTVQFWGENQTKGNWSIVSNCELDTKKMALKLIGNYSPDNHYSYDNDILNVKTPMPLTDTNGGNDTVYFTNYTNGKIHVNQSDKEIHFLSKYGERLKTVKISDGTNIENFVFGPLGGKIFH